MAKKKLSAETQLRRLKAECSRLAERLNDSQAARDAYRTRATKAEQDAAEWKARFDALLKYGKPESEAKW